MTVEYKIEPNREQLKEAIEFFEFVGGNTSDAMRIAINKAGPTIKTAASKEIRSQANLRAAYVNKRLAFKRSTRANLSAAISTPSRGILTSAFSTLTPLSGQFKKKTAGFSGPIPDIPKRGIKVKIKPDKSPVNFVGDTGNKPFFLRLKNGIIAIAARRGSPGKRGGRIKVFHGPSLSQVFDDVRKKVKPEAIKTLTEELGDAMRFILSKRK